MTPYQGDTPDRQRGQQPSGSEYQQPIGQPQQPQFGQFQGQQGQPGQRGAPTQQGQPVRQGQPTQQGQPAQQAQPPSQGPPAQSQPMGQYQQSPSAAQPPQGGSVQVPPQSAGGAPGVTPPGAQSGGMQTQPPGQTAPGPRGPGAGPRMQPVTVEEIVETDVVTAQRDTPIATVVAKMADQDVGSVVVVDNDQPVGILTDRKIALALENTPDLAQKQAGELISGDLVTGTTSMSVFEALERLSEEGIRRLPIVDDDGTLEGIISLDDVFVLLGSELTKATDTIRAQSPRY